MINNVIKLLETKYLDAKIAYYNGSPIMSDASFDIIERELKDVGSKVIEQVGYKRSDFNYNHFSPVLSLSKIQTEINNNIVNYKNVEFKKWFDSFSINSILEYTPKYDGNAINIIYKGKNLNKILTRGDGIRGKDITNKLIGHIPNTLEYSTEISENDIMEIRCEAIIPKNIFKKNYSNKFANARNLVAGILGKDDIDLNYINDIHIMPIHFLLNSKHMNSNIILNDFFKIKNIIIDSDKKYETIVKKYEELRNSFEYELDGVVISFPFNYRDGIGYNEHHYKFALAVKFVPDEVITRVVGIEWNISKTGEFNPVVLLNPVELAGTTVKRASGYNAGYIVNNKIGSDTFVSVAKAGEIIPEVQSIVTESAEAFDLPTFCSHCGSKLEFDGIHLICPNTDCQGKIAKKLASAATTLDLKNIGGKTLEPFATDFKNMYELMVWVLQTGSTEIIERFGIKYNSRSHEIFLNAFKNIQSLTYEQVIISLGYDNVGKKLSAQIAKEHCGLTPDYTGLERALVTMLHKNDVETYIKTAVSNLESFGITIDKPKLKIINNMETTVYACLTGSPKEFGYKTKEEFINQFPGIIEVSVTDKNCQYLITDSYDSTSSKMKTAEKKGIKIVTYRDFKS